MGHHHHDHEHGHDHDHSHSEKRPFDEKMAKRIEHWVRHNDEHAETYREWAGSARENGMAEIGAFLDSAANLTAAITDQLKAALARLSHDHPH